MASLDGNEFRGAGNGTTGKRVEVGRREDPQGVPAVPPRMADAIPGVEDDEAQAARL